MSESVARIEALKDEWPDNIAVQCFDPSYFATLSDAHKARLLKCLNSGIENPDSEMGCYACQPSDYDDFKPFFSKALARHHKVAEDARHLSNWSLKDVEGLPEDGVLDIAKLGLPAMSLRVRTARNLKDFPLPGSMSKQDRMRLEQRMMAVFETFIAMPGYGGRYCSITPGNPCFIDDAEYKYLVDAHIMFKDMSGDRYLAAAGIAADWPFGRGCYVSADKEFIIWLGEEDHLRIMCMQHGTVLNEVFDRLKSALDQVESIEGMEFAYSEDYGVVTSLSDKPRHRNARLAPHCVAKPHGGRNRRQGKGCCKAAGSLGARCRRRTHADWCRRHGRYFTHGTVLHHRGGNHGKPLRRHRTFGG